MVYKDSHDEAPERVIRGVSLVCGPLQHPPPFRARVANENESFAHVFESELVCLLESLDSRGDPRSDALKKG